MTYAKSAEQNLKEIGPSETVGLLSRNEKDEVDMTQEHRGRIPQADAATDLVKIATLAAGAGTLTGLLTVC
jgi:hypothetical protein